MHTKDIARATRMVRRMVNPRRVQKDPRYWRGVKPRPTSVGSEVGRNLEYVVVRQPLPRQVGQPSAFRLAADEVKLVADERSGDAVARGRHRRKDDPSVGRRLVGFERTERVIR